MSFIQKLIVAFSTLHVWEQCKIWSLVQHVVFFLLVMLHSQLFLPKTCRIYWVGLAWLNFWLTTSLKKPKFYVKVYIFYNQSGLMTNISEISKTLYTLDKNVASNVSLDTKINKLIGKEQALSLVWLQEFRLTES